MGTCHSKKQSGIVLIITIQILFALSTIALFSLKTTISNIIICGNLKDIKRAYYIAEAGTRHAAEFLKQDLSTWDNYIAPGSLIGSTYFVKGGYSVTIEDAGLRRKKIVSTGITDNGAITKIEIIFVPLCYITSTFDCAVFGDEGVNLSGASYIDSYDSSAGAWTLGTHNSNAVVGTNSTGTNSIVLNSTTVYGDACVGYGGDPDTDINKTGGAAVLGDETTLFRPKELETVTDPGGGFPETLNLPVGSKTFYSGTYRLPKIRLMSGLAVIDGDVTFYVDGPISILATAELRILAGSSLTIYASGDIMVAGSTVVNLNNKPSSFLLYGTPGCTSAMFTGAQDFYGGVYLPNADITLNGGGPIFGSVVGKTVTTVGTSEIHYDEDLKKINEECKIYDIKTISDRII